MSHEAPCLPGGGMALKCAYVVLTLACQVQPLGIREPLLRGCGDLRGPLGVEDWQPRWRTWEARRLSVCLYRIHDFRLSNGFR